jgi:DNA-binding protein HU-beta
MNKAELTARIARDTGLTKADTNRVLDALTLHVTKTLKRGGKVTLVGFGTFCVLRRRARSGRDPHTGARIRIPARRTPKFAPGKGLKDALR